MGFWKSLGAGAGLTLGCLVGLVVVPLILVTLAFIGYCLHTMPPH